LAVSGEVKDRHVVILDDLIQTGGTLIGCAKASLQVLSFFRVKAGIAVVRLSHCNSVCPSVCLSHGWISQKRCKLGSLYLHRQLTGRL